MLWITQVILPSPKVCEHLNRSKFTFFNGASEKGDFKDFLCFSLISLALFRSLSLSPRPRREKMKTWFEWNLLFCIVLWCRFVQFWSSVPFEAARFGLSHCCAARVSHRVGEKLRIVTEMSFKKSEQGGRGQRLERRRWRRGLGWRRHELLSALSAAPGARAHQCVLSLALSLFFFVSDVTLCLRAISSPISVLR